MTLGPSISKAVLLCLTLLMLSACTNSKLVIGPLYNRLDDQMRGEFHKLAKWNDEQIEHFELRAGTFHVWNRKNELTKYARLLHSIQTSIVDRGTTKPEDIKNWINTAEAHSRDARLCHPVNFSYDLMQTLTDKQVNFIEKRFASERKKNFARYSKFTPEQRRQRRVENVVKWAGRIGFDFNDTQVLMLEEAMGKQVSLRRQYYTLVDAWAKELFRIARKQESPTYQQDMKRQVNKLWTLLENAHPEEWQANRDLWRDFGFEFVGSLSYDQRVHASNWLKKMGSTLNDISKVTPSFKVQNDPTHGCQVGRAVSG